MLKTINDPALKDCPKLTKLDISDCQELVDITALSNLGGLTDLNLQCNESLNVTVLSKLVQLEQLDLRLCQSELVDKAIDVVRNINCFIRIDPDTSSEYNYSDYKNERIYADYW
jgi:Leucine-rich repeat (LRR) protein